jgi:predicted kinase
MHVMVQVAEYVLGRDSSRYIVLDGRTFSRGYQLEVWRQLAARLGVPLKVVECVCGEETARRRLERDVAEKRHVATNRTYEMYLAVRSRFEPIPPPKLVVYTDQCLEKCVRLVLDYVRERR